MTRLSVRRLAFTVAGLLCCAASQAGVQVGDVPPDYLGKNFKGDPVQISSYRGKVVVATFWATWCGPCRNEMGILENLQQIAGHERIEVIAVNDNESMDIWRTMKRKLSALSITITRDGTEKVTADDEVHAIPNMFIIDKTGHVAFIHKGYDDSALDGFLAEINQLINEQPVAPVAMTAPQSK